MKLLGFIVFLVLISQAIFFYLGESFSSNDTARVDSTNNELSALINRNTKTDLFASDGPIFRKGEDGMSSSINNREDNATYFEANHFGLSPKKIIRLFL